MSHRPVAVLRPGSRRQLGNAHRAFAFDDAASGVLLLSLTMICMALLMVIVLGQFVLPDQSVDEIGRAQLPRWPL